MASSPRAIVAADIGGTHARFGIANIEADRVLSISDLVTLNTNDFPAFENAWEEFKQRTAVRAPADLAMAFAGPVGGEILKLTNNPWAIRPATLREDLGLDRCTIVNDFAAVAHAVSALGQDDLAHLCGPGRPLPTEGVITVVGPGTGLGVAALLRRRDSSYDVIETEGGHVDFAPLDEVEEQMLRELRKRFGRVSVERIVSGPGLTCIYQALCVIEGTPAAFHDDATLWAAALSGSDSQATAALERMCLSLGAVAGDLALAQGASAVVIAGGLGRRLADHLPRSGFRERFTAKGRFEARMSDMPVKLVLHPNAGLLGAAAAFAVDPAARG